MNQAHDETADTGDEQRPVFPISVVICTHNRAGVILEGLQSTVDQSLSADRYEVLVVDNCSTDQTAEVLECFSREYGNVRVVHESVLGLSAARNRGIQEAKGDIIAFLDDDAVADRRWLESLLSAFEEVPEAVAVGGPIDLGFPGEAPDWLPSQAMACYGHFDLGDHRRKTGDLLGCNMSFYRSTLISIGGFDRRLGRMGESLLSGEESDIFLRLAEGKYGSSVYEPNARVVHRVGQERLTLGWLLRRSWAGGRTVTVWRRHRRGPLAATVRGIGHFVIAGALFAAGWLSLEARRRAVDRAMRGAWYWGTVWPPGRAGVTESDRAALG